MLDDRGIDRAVLAGASMGAHTALTFALAHPERVAALCVATPAHDPEGRRDPARLARWDALSDGLRSGGVDGFLEAYGDPPVPEGWLGTVGRSCASGSRPTRTRTRWPTRSTTSRAARRSRPGRTSRRSTSRPSWSATATRSTRSTRSRWPSATPRRSRGRPSSEEPGESPLAWQGGQLSKVIAAAQAGSGSIRAMSMSAHSVTVSRS